MLVIFTVVNTGFFGAGVYWYFDYSMLYAMHCLGWI